LKLLLDTNVLIWVLTTPGRLSDAVTDAIRDRSNDIFVSMASPWEISIKKALGNLSPPDDLETQLADENFELLQILMIHTRAVEALPHHHRDPFDRMLIAQAQVEKLTLVTADRMMRRYPVATMPV
jgi:PIN domain nuclease of toxin-antitoxin system